MQSGTNVEVSPVAVVALPHWRTKKLKGSDKMRYYAKFDAEGNRATSIVEGVHFTAADELKKYTDEGFTEISNEDQELYASNEYIRDTKTGKPVLRPPYVTTTEDKANTIATQYSSQIAELKDALATATLAGDEATVTELRAEYADLMAQYQKDLEGINDGQKM